MDLSEIKKFNTDIFSLFDDRWAVLTAGSGDHFNGMTISWGSLGTLWGLPPRGKPVATVYVRPDRFTFDFLENSEAFTISFFPDSLRKIHTVFGRKSGRDTDKLAETGLHIQDSSRGIVYAEADLTFVCRKLYASKFNINAVPEEIREAFYSSNEPHFIFIGEVQDIIRK